MVAAAVIGAAAVSAVGTGIASSQAAGAQENAATNATNAQLGMFGTAQANLEPYNFTGQLANTALAHLEGLDTGANPLTSYFGPITPNLATIAQTPGYQFNLYQGLKSTQNNATARGLGVSGAALKGAASYATGLADSTYQNQFNNLLANQQGVYNRLMGTVQLGENAGAGVGNAATETGQSIGSNLIGAGNAQAAATMNTANAATNGANGVSQAYLLNSLLKSNGGQGIFGSSVT